MQYQREKRENDSPRRRWTYKSIHMIMEEVGLTSMMELKIVVASWERASKITIPYHFFL